MTWRRSPSWTSRLSKPKVRMHDSRQGQAASMGAKRVALTVAPRDKTSTDLCSSAKGRTPYGLFAEV